MAFLAWVRRFALGVGAGVPRLADGMSPVAKRGLLGPHPEAPRTLCHVLVASVVQFAQEPRLGPTPLIERHPRHVDAVAPARESISSAIWHLDR